MEIRAHGGDFELGKRTKKDTSRKSYEGRDREMDR
jgi:hypothetical protein